MQYIVSFLEGIITFISPCLLPMLPIYISYFTGGGEKNTKKSLMGAISFVTGFTVVFIVMGALASIIGSFLKEYRIAVNIITGTIVIIFGLNFLGLLNINIFKGFKNNINKKSTGCLSAFLFGIVFSIGWTPCVGTFLGSALMLASQQTHAGEGVLMLLSYSMGLGIPFILSTILIDYFKSTFKWIKQNYKVINTVSGCLLILIGILMTTGTFSYLLGIVS